MLHPNVLLMGGGGWKELQFMGGGFPEKIQFMGGGCQWNPSSE